MGKLLLYWGLLFTLGWHSLVAQSGLLLMPEENSETPEDQQIVWETTPGVRYEVQSNTNLADEEGWVAEPDYPSVADNIVDTLPFDTSAANAQFFRIIRYDEQAPVITERFPDDGDIAIERFEEISISLEDFTGIDTTTISVDVGSLGAFTLSSPKLSYTDGVLTFDNGGDTALGLFGDSISVTLTVADTLGNSDSYSWSFDLEVEPVYEANSFIFGSPDAQRAGQFVKQTPTRVLAQRWAGGPIRMSGSSVDWTLESVLPDSIAIAYTSASAPTGFTVDQYLANLAPVTVDEIFYRQITAITDDPANKTLTLSTIDVSPAKIVTEGSLRLNAEDLAFEVDESGTIIRAMAVRAVAGSGTIEFDPFGVNFDGTPVFGSYADGNGQQQYQFGFPLPEEPPLSGSSWDTKLTLEEANLLVTPRMSVAIEIVPFIGVQDFYSKTELTVSASLIPEFSFLADALSGKAEFPLFVSKIVVPIGTTPLWVDISPYVKLKADYEIGVSGTIRTGIQGDVSTSLIVDYEKGRSQELYFTPQLGKPSFNFIAPELTVSGTLGASAMLVPGIDVRFMSLVGFDAYADPGVHFTGTASASTGETPFSASVSLVTDAHLNAEMLITGLDNVGWITLPAMTPIELFHFPASWQFPEEEEFSIIQQPSGGSFAVGDEVTLQVETNAQGAVSYQWYKDGTPLPWQTRSSLDFLNVNRLHAGEYQVKARSDGQTATSQTALVSIIDYSSAEYYAGTGHRYLYVPGRTDWYSAKTAAERLGGHLATISSNGENSFIAKLIPGSLGNAWIGLLQNPEGNEPGGGWGWVTGEPLSYTRWKSGEPNEYLGLQENWGIISSSTHIHGASVWNDTTVDVSYVTGFVVEFPNE